MTDAQTHLQKDENMNALRLRTPISLILTTLTTPLTYTTLNVSLSHLNSKLTKMRGTMHRIKIRKECVGATLDVETVAIHRQSSRG